MENQKIKEIIDFYYNSKEYHKIPTVINTCGNLEQLMVRFNCVASGQPDGNHNTNNLFYKYYENIKIESKDIIDTIKTYLQSKTNSMGYSKNLFKDDQALINILRQFGESGLNEWCTYWLQFDQETVDIMIEDIQDQLSVEYSLKELNIFDEPTKLT